MFFAVGLALEVAAWFVIPRVWRGELLGRGVMKNESELFSAWVRMMPAGVAVFFGYLLLWFLGKLMTADGERAPTWLGVISGSYMVLVLLLFGAIAGLNVPKALVPPERRDEEGLYFKGLQRRLRRNPRGQGSGRSKSRND